MSSRPLPSAASMISSDGSAEPKAPITIDVPELEKAIEEGKAAGVGSELIDQVLEIRQQALTAQLKVTAHSADFYVKLRQKSVMSKWMTSGGEERLESAKRAGQEALDLLRIETDASPLSVAIEGLNLALNEAKEEEVPKDKMALIKDGERIDA